MTATENDIEYAAWLQQPANRRLSLWVKYQNTLRRIEYVLRAGQTELLPVLEKSALYYMTKFNAQKPTGSTVALRACPKPRKPFGSLTHGNRCRRLERIVELVNCQGAKMETLLTELKDTCSGATLYRDVRDLEEQGRLKVEFKRTGMKIYNAKG